MARTSKPTGPRRPRTTKPKRSTRLHKPSTAWLARYAAEGLLAAVEASSAGKRGATPADYSFPANWRNFNY